MSPTESAERYVAGRMSEEEEQQFETAMLERPELAAEVDARQRMKAGLQVLEARGELDALMVRSRLSPYVRYAAAACVVLVLIAGFALVRSYLEAPPPAIAGSLKGLALGSTGRVIEGPYLLVGTRGRQDEAVISLKPGIHAIQLQVMPDFADNRFLLASLSKVSAGKDSALVEDVRVENSGSGLFNIFLNPALLGSGRYRLTVRRPAAAVPAPSYSFELQVPGVPPRSGQN
jgi:hypothetical protein